MILSATVKPPLCLLHAIPTQDIRQRAERFSRLSTAAAQTAERAQWRQAIEEVCEPQLYPNACSCFVWPTCVWTHVRVNGDLAVLLARLFRPTKLCRYALMCNMVMPL